MGMEEMTVREVVTDITKTWDEADVRGLLDEEMMEWVDEDDVEEHGSVYDAYCEVGRGEAERVVLEGLIKGTGVELTTDQYCEVMDTLCEIWGIYLN
jgi:hypothetical protein